MERWLASDDVWWNFDTAVAITQLLFIDMVIGAVLCYVAYLFCRKGRYKIARHYHLQVLVRSITEVTNTNLKLLLNKL